MNALTVIDEEDAPHSLFNSAAWQQIAATGHRRARPLTAAERRRADAIPDFDDPDFMAKMHTDAAPLRDRAALFIRLWNSFDPDLRAEFLSDVGAGRTG